MKINDWIKRTWTPGAFILAMLTTIALGDATSRRIVLSYFEGTVPFLLLVFAVLVSPILGVLGFQMIDSDYWPDRKMRAVIKRLTAAEKEVLRKQFVDMGSKAAQLVNDTTTASLLSAGIIAPADGTASVTFGPLVVKNFLVTEAAWRVLDQYDHLLD
mgnify:CR=1 FL=1